LRSARKGVETCGAEYV